MSTVPAASVWAGLGLSVTDIKNSSSTPPQPSLTPADALRALSAPAPSPSFAEATRRACRTSVVAARKSSVPAALAASAAPAAAAEAQRIVDACDEISAALSGVDDVARLQEDVRRSAGIGGTADRDAQFVEGFVEEVVVEPRVVRHVVDGRVGEEEYAECLVVLRKKVAVLELRDMKNSAAYKELKGVVDRLVETASAKVRVFLLEKMELLRRPNTNVHIIKQNVLLRYSALVLFLEELAPREYAVVRDAYVFVMRALYEALFTRYVQTLMAMKVGIGADATVAALSSSSSAGAAAAAGLSLSTAPLVGAEPRGAAGSPFVSSTSSFSAFFGAAKGKTVTTGSSVQPLPRRQSSASSTRTPSAAEQDSAESRRNSVGSAVDATNASAAAAAASSSASLFSIGNRIDVLAKIDASPVVLAVAVDNDLRFYYEELQRSLGRMVSETYASESAFVAAFLGDHELKLFPKIFDGVIALLVDVVNTHAAASHDIVGILLALKVNEAQRTSMQHRNILELSHYFIRVDIALKPKFKRLFDANISSLTAAASPAVIRDLFKGESDTKPHVISRQFADLSSSILAIASYGETDDAILDGTRRMRTEFVGFLTAMSALITQTKARYIFLVNNVDVVLGMYATRNVGQSSAESRFFNELHVSYTAAYVEHEVADHFPDLVSFVRNDDRRTRAEASTSASIASSAATGAPSEAHVRSVLRDFASNWHMGVAHMRDSVLRAFPNLQVGNDILRALFARLFSYHRRCETAVTTRYPALQGELVSGTEISFEVRQMSKPFA